jgi:cytidine deaminase
MDSENLIESEMYRRAIEFIPERYPMGWGGVAIIHTIDDRYLSSVAIETANSSVILCIEVGAMTEAHKYNTWVTHCLCVVRENENSPFKILSPCGVCQERLRFWGIEVKVGVTTPDNSLKFVALKELQPYHWTNAFQTEELYHR